jgi:hypothetical protein
MEAVLAEFETDPWLSRQLTEYGPEFSGKLEALRKKVSELRND